MQVNRNEIPVDVHAHVLPILEVCRFASMAYSAVGDLYDLAQFNPSFKRQMQDAASGLSELNDSRIGDQVAAALWVAIDLLERYESRSSSGGARADLRG